MPPRLRFDHGHRLGRLLGGDHGHAALDDRGLLGGDRGQRVAEEFHVVHADRRDHARERRLDHIGGIEPAAEADFEQQHVGRMLCEQQEAGRGLRLEEGDAARLH